MLLSTTCVRVFDKEENSHIVRSLLDRAAQEHFPEFTLDREQIRIPNNDVIADPQYYKPSKIDLLIGVELYDTLLCIVQIRLAKRGLTLQKTRLDWIFGGPVEEKMIILNKSYCYVKVNSDMQQQLSDLRELIVKRFLAFELRLTKNGELKTKYTRFMRKYRDMGHMSEVFGRVEAGVEYFMPHHGVLLEAYQIEGNKPAIAQIIRDDFFVEDLLTGADSIEKAAYICENVSNVLKTACFELQKWYSNEPEYENAKTLGLLYAWNQDALRYKILENLADLLSRGVLPSEIKTASLWSHSPSWLAQDSVF
ncbi:hypothetical protein ILUMI_18897 [Ignelater luminosus]|uniref:Uncharacterized protein n=1 Tax=Ignelater luminosus TaxID=2038154 RepID=A0A8K0CLK8_IGNLU|nr:hypothetical protein ILUMI_18897 [Ignelater luminosus]